MAASPIGVKEICRLVSLADSAMVTENLWGERWSKLVTNVMGNGLSACTGMIGKDMVQNDAIRHFSARLGSEAIRVGQALGYELEEIQPPRSGDHCPSRRGRRRGNTRTMTSTGWRR